MKQFEPTRRQFLKLGTVISMSTLITGCASTSPPLAEASAMPPRLRLIALGGPMKDAVRVARGVDNLRALGFELENLDCTARRSSRFAGSDNERLADLNQLADPSVPMPDLLMATRGGYGAVRLLDEIDYPRLCPRFKQHGSILMGYSDNTAVQLALLAKGGVVSFSGPMLYGDFAAHSLSSFTQHWFSTVLTQPSFTLRVEAPQSTALSCSGTLWGGNLAVLTSLVGTEYLPDVPGGILFLEDVGEDIYRVERMLQQLKLAGVLGAQSAILLGHFSNQRPDGFDPDGYTMRSMSQALSHQIQVPVFYGLPIGHVPDIIPLPIGAEGHLEADPLGFSLTVSAYPQLKHLPSAFLTRVGAASSPAQKG